MNERQRFMSHVHMCPMSGCWLWTGALQRKGYGWTAFRGASTLAHRASWAIHNGEIDGAWHVLHRCDVRSCVNPAHLFLGTNDDNVADRIAKGREALCHANPAHGDTHYRVKIPNVAIPLIRARYAAGETQRTIGQTYGVGQSTISAILRGTERTHA